MNVQKHRFTPSRQRTTILERQNSYTHDTQPSLSSSSLISTDLDVRPTCKVCQRFGHVASQSLEVPKSIRNMFLEARIKNYNCNGPLLTRRNYKKFSDSNSNTSRSHVACFQPSPATPYNITSVSHVNYFSEKDMGNGWADHDNPPPPRWPSSLKKGNNCRTRRRNL